MKSQLNFLSGLRKSDAIKESGAFSPSISLLGFASDVLVLDCKCVEDVLSSYKTKKI